MTSWFWSGSMLLALALAIGSAGAAERIEVKAGEFIGTRYLTEKEREEIRGSGYMKGFGEAEYAFTVPAAGWYELWVEAGANPTDLFLDREFLIYTPFASGVWEPQANAQKTLNLHLGAGRHVLRFSRPWPHGLPWMRRFFLEPARDATGMVRLTPEKDALAFRRGEPFPLRLKAGRLPQAYTLTLTIADTATGKPAHTLRREIPAGEGVHEETLAIPTDREGVFDIAATEGGGKAVDRTIQYLVVDTKQRPTAPAQMAKELVATIDCAAQEPDYASAGSTRVVQAPFGAYRESGAKGRWEDHENADWFAYTLPLPSVQDLYLAEVDYPDDDQRTFLVSLVEEAINPYAPTLGVTSGGEFTRSGRLQTHQFYFYPRQKNPRLFLQSWYRGQRAAAARIRVYRVTSLPPVLPGVSRSGRRFGFYQEECLRFTSYFGAMPEGNTWANIARAADRLGKWAGHVGVNLWHPTIAVYQSMMWPGKSIPGYGPADTDGWGVVGPHTLKEPLQKDLVRLMLLTSEKYGLDFIGELHMPANWVLMRELDQRFGGKGTYEDDGPQKPWLIVARDGKTRNGHFNPLYPGVQEWVASVIRELAERYKDSPAFKGVALRLMGWQFSAWQALPSIHWGYEDYTVALFEKETGVQVPVAADDPQRFARRYEWLMANVYERWVEWRCARIHAYHKRLAAVLAEARPDLALHVEAYGPTYDLTFCRDLTPEEYEEKGWGGLIRESGIDPARYRNEPDLVLNETRSYPPAIRQPEPLQAALDRALFHDPAVIEQAARTAGKGTVGAIHFDAQSMEGEMVRADQLGLPTKMPLRNKETAHGAGVLNPAGRHFLSRYADGMADGNLTYVHDGSHGYPQGQPQYLREFMAEYHALPAVGMTRLQGTGDPVALWSGQQGNTPCFYLVNRASYPVTAEVAFEKRPALKRLSSGQAVALDAAGRLRVTLQPYQLLAFGGGEPVRLAATAPPEVKRQLEAQVAFAARLLAGQGAAAGITLVPFSVVDQQRAERKLSEAKSACAAGRFVSARRALMHTHLVRVYEAFGAYPPDLFHRKAPATPEGALSPKALLERVAEKAPPNHPKVGGDRRDAPPNPPKVGGVRGGRPAVLPGMRVASGLAGTEVLSWRGRPLAVAVETPHANRFRLSFAYVSREPYARPAFLVDGKPLPGQKAQAVEETGLWGRMILLAPFALGPGAHQLEARPQEGSTAGLFHVRLEPVHRDLATMDWHVVGPFASPPGPYGKPGLGLDQVYPPETACDLDATYEGDAGQPLRWIRPAPAKGPVPPRGPGYVDLHRLTGAYNHRVGYAVTTLISPEERAAELRFGVDYWGRIWLNGEKVFEITEAHGHPVRAQYAIPVRLRKGPNELLVKVHAGSAGNGFWLSISDPGDLVVRL